jgi:hypothetical protein
MRASSSKPTAWGGKPLRVLACICGIFQRGLGIGCYRASHSVVGGGARGCQHVGAPHLRLAPVLSVQI